MAARRARTATHRLVVGNLLENDIFRSHVGWNGQKKRRLPGKSLRKRRDLFSFDPLTPSRRSEGHRLVPGATANQQASKAQQARLLRGPRKTTPRRSTQAWTTMLQKAESRACAHLGAEAGLWRQSEGTSSICRRPSVHLISQSWRWTDPPPAPPED